MLVISLKGRTIKKKKKAKGNRQTKHQDCISFNLSVPEIAHLVIVLNVREVFGALLCSTVYIWSVCIPCGMCLNSPGYVSQACWLCVTTILVGQPSHWMAILKEYFLPGFGKLRHVWLLPFQMGSGGSVDGWPCMEKVVYPAFLYPAPFRGCHYEQGRNQPPRHLLCLPKSFLSLTAHLWFSTPNKISEVP